MASYNTSGVTSYTDTSSIAGISAASGQNYGSSSSGSSSSGSSSSGSSSSGLMSSSSSRGRNRDADMYAGSKYAPTSNAGTAKAKQKFTAHATSSDNDNNYTPSANNYTPSALAPKFEAAGATLPTAKDPRDRFSNTVASSLYDSDIFKPYVPDPTEEIESYLANTAVEDALKDALGIDDTERQTYQGIPTQEEPEPNIDMSVLQGALQPEPITVEELPDVTVKAGDTLSAIAAANNLPVQDVIDANPQIKNPNIIRPGAKVKMPDPRNLGGSEGYGNPVGDLSIFSKPVDNSYTEFMDIEGDTSHLGGADYKEVGITLPMGIVPTSGLKYTHNGKTIDLPDDRSKRWAALSKAGVTLNNFDSSNVDMSQVVKDGIKRSDYDTDENFTKAVLTSFEDSVIKEIENEGVDVDKIDDATLEGLISLAWNVQGHKWKDIEPAYKEMVKDNPDMTKVQSGMLQVFTSGGIVVRGLAERRAKDYNKVAEGMGQPTIESYTPVKLKNGNAGFEYAMSDGTTVTSDTGKDYATKASQGSFKKHLNKETSL